jgi:signal transduction histidine kinase
VHVTVAAEGAGMEPDVVARALEPRFTTKQKTHHNGLGLAIVHRAVSRLGGRVTIDSSPAGTTVRLHLPDLFADG